MSLDCFVTYVLDCSGPHDADPPRPIGTQDLRAMTGASCLRASLQAVEVDHRPLRSFLEAGVQTEIGL